MAYTNDNMFKSVDWITIVIYLALVTLGWFSICGACYDYGSMDLFSFDTNSGKQLVWIGGALALNIFWMSEVILPHSSGEGFLP